MLGSGGFWGTQRPPYIMSEAARQVQEERLLCRKAGTRSRVEILGTFGWLLGGARLASSNQAELGQARRMQGLDVWLTGSISTERVQ